MRIMLSTHSSGTTHYLAGRYPDSVGWLISPGAFKEPREWLPYALDNGKFGAWKNQTHWFEAQFFELLDRCKICRFKPMWVLVPDAVGNKEETKLLWPRYEKDIRRYGWPLAFAVQDGMTIRDVPTSADVIFVGGTTTWKWRNAANFVAAFPRVHVGRVNWVDKLEYCEQLGVESCDGTGFFRGGPDSIQAEQLKDFIAGHRRCREQQELFV